MLTTFPSLVTEDRPEAARWCTHASRLTRGSWRDVGGDRGEQPGHVVGAHDRSSPAAGALPPAIAHHRDVSGEGSPEPVDVAEP